MLGGAAYDDPNVGRNLAFDELYGERVRQFSYFLDDGVVRSPEFARGRIASQSC